MDTLMKKSHIVFLMSIFVKLDVTSILVSFFPTLSEETPVFCIFHYNCDIYYEQKNARMRKQGAEV